MAKFNSKAITAKISDLTLITDPAHPRFDPRAVEPLKAEQGASISARGIVEAIVINPDGEILNGRNRYRWAKELGIEAVRIQVRDEAEIGVKDDIDAVLLSHELNAAVKEVSPLQQANDAQRALAAGKSRAAVATAMGIPESRLDALLKLAKSATAETKKAIEKGVISVTAAEYLAPLAPAEQAKVLAAAQQIASDAAAVKGKQAKTTDGGVIKASNIDIRSALASLQGKQLPESAQRNSDKETGAPGPRTGPAKRDEVTAMKDAVGKMFGTQMSEESKKAMQFTHALLSLIADGNAIGDSVKQRFPELAAAVSAMRS